MNHNCWLWRVQVIVIVVLWLMTGAVHAQPAPAINADLPDPLPGFPRPPRAPASLFAPAEEVPTMTPYSDRYFEYDPLLDVDYLPQPGWIAAVDIGLFGTHMNSQFTEVVTIAGTGRPPNVVQLASAPLNWTVSPRFEVGRRFTSGFGEFTMSYRFLITRGVGSTSGADALAALNSRFSLHIVDFDYGNREVSLWPSWEMKWRAGVRGAFFNFVSTATEPFAAAAAGRGVFQTSATNYYGGVGPHVSLELWRHLGTSPWSPYGQLELSWLLGNVTQNFAGISTTAAPGGAFIIGATRDFIGQEVPTLSARLGLQCHPPALPRCEFFLGYQFEQWWNVGNVSTSFSRAQFYDHGAFVRGTITF
jgi:hypothetical protein